MENNRLEYVGATKNGLPWGKGKLTYKNGDKYEGSFENNTRHGFGKLAYATDDEFDRVYYVGQFFNDLQQGTGKMHWKGRGTYEGEWGNGHRHGYGKYTSANGDVYEGYYFDGAKSGDGTLSWKSGQKFVGTFKNDSPTKGTFTYRPDASTIKYEGDLRGYFDFHGKLTSLVFISQMLLLLLILKVDSMNTNLDNNSFTGKYEMFCIIELKKEIRSNFTRLKLPLFLKD